MIKDKIEEFLQDMQDYIKETYPEITEGMNDAILAQLARVTTMYQMNIPHEIEEEQLVHDNAEAVRQSFRIMKIKVGLYGLEKKVWRILEVPMVLDLDMFCRVVLGSMGAQMMHLYKLKYKKMNFVCEGDIYGEGDTMEEVYLPMLDLQKRSKLTVYYDFGEDYRFSVTVMDIHELDHMPSPDDIKVVDGMGFGIWEDAHWLMELSYNDYAEFKKEVRRMEMHVNDFPVHEKFSKEECIMDIHAAIVGDEADLDDLWEDEDEGEEDFDLYS